MKGLRGWRGGGRGRPWEVHASQGLKVGLYTPAILGGNSYLSWFYDRGAKKDPAHTGTSKGLSQAINSESIRKFLPKCVYVTIQSHGLSAGAQTHYVTANGVRDRLREGRREGGREVTPKQGQPPIDCRVPYDDLIKRYLCFKKEQNIINVINELLVCLYHFIVTYSVT